MPWYFDVLIVLSVILAILLIKSFISRCRQRQAKRRQRQAIAAKKALDQQTKLDRCNLTLDRALAGEVDYVTEVIMGTEYFGRVTGRMGDVVAVCALRLHADFDQLVSDWRQSRAGSAFNNKAAELTRKLVNVHYYGSHHFDKVCTILAVDLSELRADLLNITDAQRTSSFERAINGSLEALHEYLALTRLPMRKVILQSTGKHGWESEFDHQLSIAGVRQLEKSEYPEDFDRVVARVWPEASSYVYAESITPTRAAALLANARNGSKDDARYLWTRCKTDRELALIVTVSVLAELRQLAFGIDLPPAADQGMYM